MHIDTPDLLQGFCCGLSGSEGEDCSLASPRQIFLTLPAAGAQRSVLGGKIADTRRPGPPPVGGGTRLWYTRQWKWRQPCGGTRGSSPSYLLDLTGSPLVR